MEWSADFLQELPLIGWILTPHHVPWDSTQIKLNHLTFPKFDLFSPLTFIALLDPSFLFGRSLPFTLFCKNTVLPSKPQFKCPLMHETYQKSPRGLWLSCLHMSCIYSYLRIFHILPLLSNNCIFSNISYHYTHNRCILLTNYVTVLKTNYFH